MVDRILLERIAHEHGVDPTLVYAVVLQESDRNPFAYRPEPRFRYFVDARSGRPFRAISPDELGSKVAPPDFPTLAGSREQEWWGQQASWGLMQLMGALAREQGFRGPYLTELCDPPLNLGLGCHVLKGHLDWAHGDVALALGSYNAGRGGARGAAGQAYAQAVLARKVALR